MDTTTLIAMVGLFATLLGIIAQLNNFKKGFAEQIKSQTERDTKMDEAMEVVDERISGKTWRERVEEYFSSGGSVDDIVRIAETETHRDANTAALDTAKKVGATKKTWVTMMDDRVRDTHSPLEGVSAPIDGEFVTWDGDRAQAPGLFKLAENNVNCRCELIFS